ncbi:hypothetical protein H0H92_007377 [Tricholoma furcatifolium]|nr:hypothetical protein H0H92_007377 [Tricholoma furcatifolium]
MVRTTKNARTAPARKQRAAAPVQFDFGDDDEMGNEEEPLEELSRIPKDHRDRQAKMALVKGSAYQTQKKAIYAAARKSAQDVSRSGIAYIRRSENAIAEMQGLRDQEWMQEKAFGDYEQLLSDQESASTSLLSFYPPLVNDIALRRSKEVNAASEMQRSNPSRRETALRNFSKNARVHVEEARQNEQTATDASALLKHYKNLLCA